MDIADRLLCLSSQTIYPGVFPQQPKDCSLLTEEGWGMVAHSAWTAYRLDICLEKNNITDFFISFQSFFFKKNNNWKLFRFNISRMLSLISISPNSTLILRNHGPVYIDDRLLCWLHGIQPSKIILKKNKTLFTSVRQYYYILHNRKVFLYFNSGDTYTT